MAQAVEGDPPHLVLGEEVLDEQTFTTPAASQPPVIDVDVSDVEPAEAEPVVEPATQDTTAQAPTQAPDVADDEEARTKAMRAFHAQATKAGVSHEELHAWAAKAFEAASMSELTLDQIRRLHAGLDAGEIPPAPGWPHQPAATPGDRSRQAQWIIMLRRADQAGVSRDEVNRIFEARYGFHHGDADRDQAQAFGDWFRGYFERRAKAVRS